MANLDFSIQDRPIMDDACDYCGVPIQEKHIRIQFELGNKMRIHITPCWSQFVTGVKVVDEHLMEKVN